MNVKRLISILVLLLPIVAGIVTMPPIVQAQNVYIDPILPHYIILVNTTPVPGITTFDYNFTSLSDALFNLSQIDATTGYSWAVIYVNNEYFEDAFYLEYSLHDLSIIGIGAPVINALEPSAVLVFKNSDNITIDNIIFTNFSGEVPFTPEVNSRGNPQNDQISIEQYLPSCNPAILINSSTGVVVQNTMVINSCIAIGILNSSLTLINNVTIYNATFIGIYGLDINDTTIMDSLIIPLSINLNSHGMLIYVIYQNKNYNLTILDTVINDIKRFGAYIYYTDNIYIDNLTISNGNYDGLGVFDSRNVTVLNYYAYNIGYSGIYGYDLYDIFIENATVDTATWYGLELYDTDNLNVLNFTALNMYSGFYLWNISNSELTTLYTAYLQGNGVELNLSDNIVLSSIIVHDPRIGLLINGSSNAVFSNVVINDTWDKAILVNSSNNIQLINFSIYNATKYGIYINFSSNVYIDNAQLHDIGADGIYVYYSNKTVILNTFINITGVEGIAIRYAFNTTINGARMYGIGSDGVYARRAVELFISNIFINNTRHDGIDLNYCDNITIYDATVLNSGDNGLEISDVYNISMYNLFINNTDDNGIDFNDVDLIVIDNATIGYCDEGFEWDDVSDALVFNVTIVYARGDGIELDDCYSIDINNLTIYDSRIGARILYSHDIHGSYITIFNITETPIITINVHDVLLNVTYPGLLRYFLDMMFYGTVTIHNIDYSAVPLPTNGLLPVGVYMNVSLEPGSWLWLNYTFNPLNITFEGIRPSTLTWWYWGGTPARWRSIPSENIIISRDIGYAIGNYSSTGTIIGIFGASPAVGGKVIEIGYGGSSTLYILVFAVAIAAVAIMYLIRRYK